MRAKRSKKYRKIMSNYNLQFSFRTPYQVLCDSDFLRQCHAFHMPVQKSLTNTLHGDARPYITQCSLAKAVADHKKDRGRGDGKPLWLPPPTEVPLRYCKHKDAEGNEVGVIDEMGCLVDLISGQPKGNEARKNKNHYVLATAEEVEDDPKDKRKQKNGADQNVSSRKRKRGPDVRDLARQVPGVPIVYVKRSVMVLEEMSGASERMIRGAEKEKLKDGLIGDVRGLKRKRRDGDDEDESDSSREERTTKQTEHKSRRSKKAKEPNPLSVKRKKVRPPVALEVDGEAKGDTRDAGTEQQKKKRRRKRGKNGNGGEQSSTAEMAKVDPIPSQTQAADIDAEP